jgi:nitrate reductase NapE component
MPPRTQVLARPRKGRPARIQPAAMLLRFISCGLISLGAGLAWFLSHRGEKLSPAGSLFGILLLLGGFALGGALWYLVDARRRARDPQKVDDEYIVFSFVVFVLVPLMVLAVVLLVWVAALLVGR